MAQNIHSKNHTPKIKICGLFQEVDTVAVNAAMPDFAGFVFYKKSKRFVTPEFARKLRQKIDQNIRTVGIFVDEPIENILKLHASKTIDIAQLHGLEDDIYIKELKEKAKIPVIKAFHGNYYENSADYALFDNFDPATIGGTGKTFDWSLIPKIDKPLFLAGGLNSENILNAIKSVRPYAVDISSGVETNGHKDFDKILEIVNLVRGQNL